MIGDSTPATGGTGGNGGWASNSPVGKATPNMIAPAASHRLGKRILVIGPLLGKIALRLTSASTVCPTRKQQPPAKRSVGGHF
jgi:hypothetical protein